MPFTRLQDNMCAHPHIYSLTATAIVGIATIILLLFAI